MLEITDKDWNDLAWAYNLVSGMPHYRDGEHMRRSAEWLIQQFAEDSSLQMSCEAGLYVVRTDPDYVSLYFVQERLTDVKIPRMEENDAANERAEAEGDSGAGRAGNDVRGGRDLRLPRGGSAS